MTYVYMTPDEFAEHTKQSLEAIADITPSINDTMSIMALINLQELTNNRFMFDVDSSGLYASCRWVDYYQTKTGNYKIDDTTGKAALNDVENKKVVVG